MSKGSNKKPNTNRQAGSRTTRRKYNKKRVFILVVALLLIVFLFFKAVGLIFSLIFGGETLSNGVLSISNRLEQFDINDEQTKKGKRFTIIIDPGHGGKDSGAIASGTEIYEKDIALSVSKKISSILLRQNDIEVILTRADDTFLSLVERGEVANRLGADLFVSIHANSFPDIPSAYGIETYYLPSDTYDSETLAEDIQKTLVSYVDTRDRGTKTSVFKVLETANMPSVLVELGFLSNIGERMKLIDESYQDELAKGVAQGILTFIDNNLK